MVFSNFVVVVIIIIINFTDDFDIYSYISVNNYGKTKTGIEETKYQNLQETTRT